MTTDARQPALQRVLSLPLITFYGLGTILGAGIYVLVGKIAGVSGLYTPLAFVLAAVVAGLTGFSYAELSSRLPLAGGEVVYVEEAFHRRGLSTAVGLAIVLAGLVSAATITRGFVGYLDSFVSLPAPVAIIGTVSLLCAIASWGVRESAWLAALATGIELLGLGMVLVAGWPALQALPAQWPALLPGASLTAWSGVMLGAFLAFFAFIGFEDMVNMAEEVREPERNLPLAILLALGLATLFYILIALVAVLSLPAAELAASEAALTAVYRQHGGEAVALLGVISLFAVINGALVQIIMAARMLYGLARTGAVPAVFGRVHPGTGTPVIATVLVAAGVMLMALGLPLVTLASLTSAVMLAVFALINLALVVLKRRAPAPDGVRIYPAWIPKAGLLTAVLLLLVELLPR